MGVWDLIEKTDELDCWNWKGAVNKYGSAVYKSTTVARYLYIMCFGEISKEQTVSHRCNNLMCCNPDHFYLTKKGKSSFRISQKAYFKVEKGKTL